METKTKRNLGRAAVIGLTAKLGITGAVLLFVACQGEEAAPPPQTVADRRIDALASELELDEGQRGRLEAVRDLVHERRDAFRAEREESFEGHLEALESGEIDSEELHAHIDEKIEELRQTAHAVADEVVALVESMDDEQRARAAAKIRTFHERMESFHEAMEGEGGHGAMLNHLRERICSDDGEAALPLPPF